MHKKAQRITIAVVAATSFGLMALLPGVLLASTQSVRPYCQSGVGSQYDASCATGPISPLPTVSSSVPAGTSATSVSASAGPASAITSLDLSKFKVGVVQNVNGVAVLVLKRYAHGSKVSLGGVTLFIPDGAILTIAKDGTATVTAISRGRATSRVAHRTASSTVVDQDVVLPAGRVSRRFAYALGTGVSFGIHASWAHIAKDVAVETIGTKTSALTVRAAANRARSSATFFIARAARSFEIKFAVGKLNVSAVEKSLLKARKLTTLTSELSVASTTTRGTAPANDAIAFSYPL